MKGILKSIKMCTLIISLVLIILMLSIAFLIPKEVQGAVKVDDNAYLQSFGNLLDLVGMKDLVREDGKHLVKEIFKVYYNDGDAWYPAFCIDPDKSGVGTGAGDGYNIKVTDFDNPAIWRAIYWGYMKDYNPSTRTSNWTAWGCRNDDDLYQAVKCVVHALVENKKYDDAYCIVDIVTSETKNMDWSEVQARSKEIIDAGRKIYEKAIGTNDTYKIAQIVLKKEATKVEGDYSVITYKVTDDNNHQIDSYNVLISGFPQGTIETHSGTTIKIKIPLNANSQDYTGTIVVKDVKVKTYPLYAGIPVENSSWQRYAILTDPFQYLSKDTTNNLITEDVKIFKKDSTNQKPLQGAVFDMYKDNNLNGKIDSGEPKVKTGITTDSNGTATITDLEQGAYLIKETKAPDGYRVSQNLGSVKLYALDTAKTKEITMYNAPQVGKLSISKTDSITNAKLQGAEFDVYLDNNNNNKIDSEDEKVDHLVTNSNGEAISKELLVYNKKYILKETKAPSNYNIKNEITTGITLTDNTAKNINIKNDHDEGKLHILKVDKDNHKVGLGHIGFIIKSHEFGKYIKWNKEKDIFEYTENKDNAHIFYTDWNGDLTIENLRTGKYTLSETVTNEWYYSINDIDFEISKDKTKEILLENELKKGSIKIIKIDEEDKEVKLANVKFDVYVDKNENGIAERNEYVDTLITDKNGETATKKYTIRDYRKLILIETETQTGYILDSTPKIIELKENQITTIVFENKAKKGNGKIIKTDEYNNTKSIEGAVFEVYEDVNNNGKIEKSIDKLVDTLTTGKDGTATSKDLRVDRNYLYIEIKTPDSYILDTTVRAFKVEYNKIINHNVVNRPKTIQIEVIKTDSEDKTIKVPDVEFTIYEDINKNGKIDKEDKMIDKIITDKNGKAISKSANTEDKSKVLRMEEKYILKETKHNIAYNDEDIEKVLDFTKYLKNGEYKEGLKETLKIENKPITTKVNPHKEDRDTHKPLAGAEFDIYEDTNKNDKLDKEDKVVFHTKTKENGYSENLTFRYGTYFVKETKAPEGYTLDHVISTFKVVSQNQKIEINFADKVIENDINIIKKANNDSIKYGIKKNEGIPDTYFVLYKIAEKGNIIDFAKDKFDKYIGEKIVIDGKEYYTVKTDETGNVQVTVPYGKYLFKEIKTHDLFLNDSKDNIIDILDDGKQVSLEFYNTAVNLELDISKTGINQAQPNDIIRYDFPNLINKSNVSLDNFTWWDHLPSKYTKITKLYTGTWNEDLNFKVYYKTNKNDYKQYGVEYSTLVNNCIDFESLGLNDESNEYITDFKIEFGTVKSGFTFTEAPFIFTRIDSDVKETDEWTNKTKLTGQYTDVNGNVTELEDNDEHTTTTYKKELKIKTLPRTGNDLSKTTIAIRTFTIVILIVSGEVVTKYNYKNQ